MKLSALHFDDEENFDSATVVLSADEVTFIAKLIGDRSAKDNTEFLIGSDSIASEIYSGLTGAILNRLFEDGVDDAIKNSSVLGK